MKRPVRNAKTDAGSTSVGATDAPIRVPQAFRISAVRRPPELDPSRDHGLRPVRVSDEELVEMLWTRRRQLGEHLVEQANAQLNSQGIVKVELQTVEPVPSVLVRLVFNVAADELPKIVGADEAPARSRIADRVADCAVAGIEKVATSFKKLLGTPELPVSPSPESAAGLSAAVTLSIGALLEEALDGPVAVSAAPEVRPAKPATARGTSTWDRLTPLLVAVGTGVGVLGFVTFVGGMIVWARVSGAGLPQAPTLGVLPSQDLLVIGAETLVPTVLIACGVVVSLAIAYVFVRWAYKRSKREHRLSAQEDAFLAGEAGLLTAAGMFGFVFLALIFTLTLQYEELPLGQFLLGITAVIVAAVIAGIVGSLTRRLVYLATTTFILTTLFVGLVAYWRAGNEERIRGAAIVRDNHQAIYGIFVAEGAGRVYLARLATRADGKIDRSASRLVGVAKSQITDIAIADRKTPAKAQAQALQLAKELCALQPALPSLSSGQSESCLTPSP